jgi:hypothetical protein
VKHRAGLLPRCDLAPEFKLQRQLRRSARNADGRIKDVWSCISERSARTRRSCRRKRRRTDRKAHDGTTESRMAEKSSYESVIRNRFSI